MSDLKAIQQEEKSLDDYVFMSNIILTNKEFFPKPPDPKTIPEIQIQNLKQDHQNMEEGVDEEMQQNNSVIGNLEDCCQDQDLL
jgi:hypothetical protein